MISSESGYFHCESKTHLCVFNEDWKAQIFNKENLEYAHQQILKMIDEHNLTAK